MSFVFDVGVEIQDLGRHPAKPAKPANSANSADETGGTGVKLATLATLAGAHSQNAKSEGPGIEVGYPPPGTFFEADERCPDAMAKPDPLWGRVAITEPCGRTVEVDAPNGWTITDWSSYAERYHGPGCAVTPIAGLPKPRAPIKLDEALRAACEGVAGITPAQFRSLLCPEDIKDIEGGGIHRKTLHAFAAAFAEGIRSGRIAVLPERKGAKLAPSGAVAITEAEIEAARTGRLVVTQGTFSGAPEVKA